MEFGKLKLKRCRYGWMLFAGPVIGKCFELYGQYSESEIMIAVVPSDHLEFRERPGYRYGLQPLRRRHVINAVTDQSGMLHYFIGTHPPVALRKSLGI